MTSVQEAQFVTTRIRELPSSPTLAVAKQAQALRQQGIDVVDFGPGEPDFDTPEHVLQAAIGAMEAGFTHYAPSQGLPELRRAIADKLARENGVEYDPAEIVVTPGAKQAIVEAIFTAIADGEEVIILEPSWPSYAAIVALAEGTPVAVQLREDFTIDPDRLRSALGPRTRAILVGTPGNPTGHILTADELRLLADVCREHDLLLLSDEIYERISYPGVDHISPASLPGMRERTVTINGFSKAYAMTGWRLGYAAAPASFMQQMLKVHEHTVTTATSFVQVGGVAALDGPQEPVRAMVDRFAARREIIVSGLNRLPGVTCDPPDGAFYAFPNISGTGLTGTALAQLLLRHGVALTPGCGFGPEWDSHVRISYATSEERIETGLARMAEALATR